MAKQEFKKAVNTNKKIAGLSQPKSFLQNNSSNKPWDDYVLEIEQQQENYDQVIYSVAVEPSLKEAIQFVGKNKGRVKGGAKAVIREALMSYFNEHPEFFD